MRNALLFCVAMASFATPAADDAPRPAVSVYFAEQKNALAAYQRRDVTAMLAAAQAMLVANPGHPPARYTLAAAQALAGRGDDALAGLEALADLGLVQQPRREPAFASLLDDPRFAAVEARFAANAQPRGKVRIVLEAKGLPGDFIPEAFARDDAGERTLFASVRQRRIVAVSDDGEVSDFVPASRHGLMSALGLHVVGDEVLVASSGMAEMRPADKALVGGAGVFAFARGDGELRGRWLLPPPTSGRGHAIGDLLPLADGRVLATDSGRGILWLLDRGTGHWYRLAGGPELAQTADWLGSPQGIADLGDGRFALADYTTGLWIVSDLSVHDGVPKPSQHAARGAAPRARSARRARAARVRRPRGAVRDRRPVRLEGRPRRDAERHEPAADSSPAVECRTNPHPPSGGARVGAPQLGRDHARRSRRPRVPVRREQPLVEVRREKRAAASRDVVAAGDHGGRPALIFSGRSRAARTSSTVIPA
jgi:hypothetical protein